MSPLISVAGQGLRKRLTCIYCLLSLTPSETSVVCMQEQSSVLSGSMERYGKLFQLWRFIEPDWTITLTGIVLYALIGASGPILGTLVATINAVSCMCTFAIIMATNHVCELTK